MRTLSPPTMRWPLGLMIAAAVVALILIAILMAQGPTPSSNTSL